MSAKQLQATIIIPTYDHGMTLQYPLQCLKHQTISDFEVFVIGDGVPDELKPRLLDLVSEDERFRFIDHPKHSRRGEPHRHEALLIASGRIVCYLCDRDLWLPDHVEQMLKLLSTADYVHSLPLHVLPGGDFRTFPVDLGFEGYRHMMLTMSDNRIPFSCFAHTLEAYHSLKEGWTTTPDNYWTDLYMFRKFFAAETLCGTSGVIPTAVTFPSPPRKAWTEPERIAELETWQRRLNTSEGRLRFQREVLCETVLEQRKEAKRLGELASQLHRELESSRMNTMWRRFV